MSNSATDWLDQHCRSIDTIRAGAMLLNAGPAGSRSARVINWPSNSDVNPHLLKLAQAAMATNEPQWKILQRPGDHLTAATTAVAYPLCSQGQVQGAVTVEYAGSSDAQRQSAIRTLQTETPRLLARLSEGENSAPQILGIAGATQAARKLITNQANLISLIVEAVEPVKVQEAYTGLVNDLARRFDARRVSIAEAMGKRAVIRAISNTAEFDSRSAAVTCIARTMQEAKTLERTIVYPHTGNAGDEEDLAAHKTLAMDQADISILTLPLAIEGKIFGVILLERSNKNAFGEEDAQTLEQCGRLLAPILWSKLRLEQPLHKKLGESGRTLLVTCLGSQYLATKLFAILIFCATSFLVTYEDVHRLTGNAAVQPISKFVVTSPFDGYVAHSYHKVGDVVKAGDVLVDLDQRDLKLEQTKWEGELAKLTKEYRAALARRDRTEVRIMHNRQEQVHTQLELVQTLLDRSNLVAPIDGIIIHGDLDEAGGSPIARGQLLFEVAQLDSYRVEIKINEADIADVVQGQTGQLLLTSMPDKRVDFVVDTVVPVAQGADGQNSFLVYASLPADQPHVRPGMEGVAKIHVGQKNLMWIYSHKLTDWIKLQWWRLGW